MSYSLNSLQGVIQGIIWGTTIGVTKGDTRSLDYSSYNFHASAVPSTTNPKPKAETVNPTDTTKTPLLHDGVHGLPGPKLRRRQTLLLNTTLKPRDLGLRSCSSMS